MEEFIKINKQKYEELCKEACGNFISSGDKEKDEERLLFNVCRNVFRYLKVPLEFISTGDNNIDKYLWNLQYLVSKRQTEPFDTLKTPSKYIFEVLDEIYKSEDK